MLKRLLKLPGYVWTQLMQIVAGLRELFSWSFVDDVVPDWFLRITVEALPMALAADEPKDQIEGSVILIGWALATSLVTGLATAVFVAVWGVFLLIGIARLSDAGSGTWDTVTSFLSPSLPGRDSDGHFGRRKER